MKKLFLSAVSTLAIAGVAVAADSTEFGVLYVPSTARETIVAVPWLASGTGNDTTQDAVKVADLVLTSGLEVGDQLMYYPGSGTTYQCWVLQADQTTGVKSWVPGNTVTKDGVSTAAGENDATLKRGQAIILKRDREGITKGFDIMGKPSSASGSVTLALSSDGKSPAYTMIAPPFATDTDINTAMGWSGINGEKDSLQLSDGTTLGWKKSTSTWGVYEKDTSSGKNVWNWNDSRTIPEGTGFWFVTFDTVGPKTVSWPK